MVYYAPGTEEKDPKKIIMSLQQAHETTATNTTNIATNTADIATNTSDIAALTAVVATKGTVSSVATSGLATGGPITTTGTVTVTGAVKSDQTTATSTTTAVTPAVQQNHPSAIKAWVKFTDNGSAASISASYNVTSITRNGTGDYTINFTTAFADINYVGVAMGSNDGSVDASVVRRPNVAQTTGAMRFLFTNAGGTATNANPGYIMFVGNQ